MRYHFLFIFLFIGAFVVSRHVDAQTNDNQILYWKNIPVKMVIPINKETLIRLPFEANLHMPKSLMANLEYTLNQNHLILKPRKPIQPSRVKIVPRVEGAPIILLDIAAVVKAPHRTIDIELPNAGKGQGQGSDGKTVDIAKRPLPINQTKEHPYSLLARYIFQRLYAPERLWEHVPGVRQVEVPDNELPLYEGGAFKTRPIFSYKYRNYYATAVLVTNTTSLARELDVRRVRGRYKARAGHFFYLHPQGHEQSETAIVLITAVPFEQAVSDFIKVTGG